MPNLAVAAARIEPVTDVLLRTPEQWRIIGKPMQRIDIVAKSTGTQRYGIDADIDGMVHATVLMNPAQTGPINGFDATEARKMRGVIDIVPVTGGVGIVADNTWRAFQAAQAIEADWGAAPFPATMDEHWGTLAASFDEDHRDSTKRDDGDVEAALAGADEVLEAEYRVPYAAHAPLEPINAVVRVDEDAVEVWTGTQIPRFVQANIAKITGIDADNITVHVAMMGGSFGHRLEDEVVKQATEIAMQMKGTPVKLTYSREEDMMHDFPRQIAMARLRGAVKDGQVDTLDLSIAMPSITLLSWGGRASLLRGQTARSWQGPGMRRMIFPTIGSGATARRSLHQSARGALSGPFQTASSTMPHLMSWFTRPGQTLCRNVCA